MLALVVTVRAADAEIASDELWSLGVVAIEERRVGTDQAGDKSIVELWTSLGDDVPAASAALAALRHEWRFEDVDATVSETWREFATPTWVEPDLVVYPAWQAISPTGGVTGAQGGGIIDDDVIAIAIEPGATFGLGDHPTTVLTMRAMRAQLREGSSVLDVGCGSGVLAIAACRLGAEFADGIDISPAAVPTTIANAVRNGVGHLVRASTTPLSEVEGPYDVVVANVLAPALIDLSADLRRVLAPGGGLVISGILADHHDHVLEALQPLLQAARIDQDGWTAITLRG